MKNVKIHWSKGTEKGIVNHFSGENAELSGRFADRQDKEKVLIAKATHMASAWASLFPDTTFRVVVTDI